MFGGPSGRLPVPSTHNFTQVPATTYPRSAFDRSHTRKLTCQASDLIPYFVDEVLPGDTFSLNSTIFARLSTPLVPAMDNLEVTTQFFYVPDRILWTNHVRKFGQQDNPADSISYTTPQMAVKTPAVMDLWDFMGLQPGVAHGGTAGYLSAMPFRAYNRIYNDWYRDQNIQNSVTVNTGDGPDAIADYALLQRGSKKDYFWGALTAAQKGTAVSLPLGTSAPIVTTGVNPTFTGGTWTNQSIAVNAGGVLNGPNSNGSLIAFGNATGLQADLTNATASTINAIRLAFQQQRFLERDMRGGTRYNELNLSHFGVVNPDSRLQRSEFLGQGSAPLNLTPIPQTSATGLTGGSTKIGDLAAFGVCLSNRNGFTKSFTEHGWVIGILNIRIPSLVYQQGLHRMWTRLTRWDHYFPVFANLGEQTLSRSEIYYVGDKAGANTDATIFGYQERWAEYRYFPSSVAGLFRSAAAQTLDTWHFATKYASAPSLNSTFLPDPSATLIDRNLALTHGATVAQFKVDIFNKLHCARVMPVNSVPGNIDRF